MAIGPGTAAVTGAGMQTAGGAIQGHYNRKLAREQNEQNIQFQLATNQANWERDQEVMRMQRYWAEQDWDKVNAYNHPTQQMLRYKEAGLNPQLIYGNANNSPAAMIRSTPAQHTGAKAPQVNNQPIMDANARTIEGITGSIGNALNSYIALKSLENQTQLIGAQTAKILSETDLKKFDYQFKNEVRDALVSNVYKANEKLGYDTEISRITGRNMPSREMAIERYLTDTAKSDAQAKVALEMYKKLQKENLLKERDIQTLERLEASGVGMSYIIQFLKIITQLSK